MAGRSGSEWMEETCRELDISTKFNRVDIGVRGELMANVFSQLKGVSPGYPICGVNLLVKWKCLDSNSVGISKIRKND